MRETVAPRNRVIQVSTKPGDKRLEQDEICTTFFTTNIDVIKV